MPITPNAPAPYTSAPALLKVIEGYRNRGLQTPFSVDVLIKANVSEALAPRTMQALELLDLVDEGGNPTETLEALRRAPETEYRERFADFLRSAYAEVFAFADPREDSRERIRDAFRDFTPRGQQERMVSLFLALCAYAGLIEAPPPAVRAASAVRRSQKQIQRGTTTRRVGSAASTEAVARIRPATTPPPDRHPFVVGLIQSLPEVGSVWPDQKRDDWVQAAMAVFNMIYERPPEDSVVQLQLSPGTRGGESG